MSIPRKLFKSQSPSLYLGIWETQTVEKYSSWGSDQSVTNGSCHLLPSPWLSWNLKQGGTKNKYMVAGNRSEDFALGKRKISRDEITW